MSMIKWETVKEYEDITYKKCNGVARIAFNRPNVRNAFRPKTTSELYDAFYDANEDVNTIDGVKIDFADEWIHLRKSNTEPIIRIYTEAPTQIEADDLAERFVKELKGIAKI